MKTVAKFLAFSLIASLTGCVTVQSNTKSDAVPATFRRILIVTKMRNAPANYLQQFAGAFPAGYEVCTLALSPLSFDKPDDAIRKQVEDCHSEAILTLEEIQAGYARRYGRRVYSSSYECNAEMKSVATGQPFWKAIISADPYWTGRHEAPPGSIIKRLLADHIIEGKMSTGGSWQAAN